MINVTPSTIILLVAELIISFAFGFLLIKYQKKKSGHTKTILLGIGSAFLFSFILSSVLAAIVFALRISFINENSWQGSIALSVINSFFTVMAVIFGYRFISKRREVVHGDSLSFGTGFAICNCAITFLSSLTSMLALSIFSMSGINTTEDIKNTLENIRFIPCLNDISFMILSSLFEISVSVLIFSAMKNGKNKKLLVLTSAVILLFSLSDNLIASEKAVFVIIKILVIAVITVISLLFAKKTFSDKSIFKEKESE